MPGRRANRARPGGGGRGTSARILDAEDDPDPVPATPTAQQRASRPHPHPTPVTLTTAATARQVESAARGYAGSLRAGRRRPVAGSPKAPVVSGIRAGAWPGRFRATRLQRGVDEM